MMALADSYGWLSVEAVAVTYDSASDAAMEGGDSMVSRWIFYVLERVDFTSSRKKIDNLLLAFMVSR